MTQKSITLMKLLKIGANLASQVEQIVSVTTSEQSKQFYGQSEQVPSAVL